MLSAALAAVTSVCGWSLYQIPPEASASIKVEPQCYLDGKNYSVGSAMKMTSGVIRECVVTEDAARPYWRDFQQGRSRHPAGQLKD